MNIIAEETWQRLLQVLPSGEELKAQLAVAHMTSKLFAAIDNEKKRHLLVLLSPEDSMLVDTQSRGLKVSTRELKVFEKNNSRYIDIECCDLLGHDAFNLIGGDIAQGLSKDGSVPADAVVQVLSKWRRFWGQIPRQILTREEQIGLFAELWFLINWLIPLTNHKVAIERWRGPFGARNDFEWEGCAIEVKATTSRRAPIFYINGLDQLEVPDGAKLLFFGLQLEEEGGASLSLPSLVAKCKEILASDSDVLSQFESGLIRAGYSFAHENEYCKMHLRIVEEALFKVESDFPRLTKKSFSPKLPAGIERVEYEINLSSFVHLVLSKSASQCTF